MSDPVTSVQGAIAELTESFGEPVVEPDGQGGAYVTLPGIELGPRWSPPTIDLSFHLPFNYPDAPVYPFFAPPGLAPADGGATPQALQQVGWRERPVTQISLRANRWKPQHDTATGAVMQVIHRFHNGDLSA
jgi:hypothetical protein